MVNEAKSGAVDPLVRKVLDGLDGSFYVDLDTIPAEAAMAIVRPSFAAVPPPPDTKDVFVPAADGSSIRVRLYYPADAATGLPVLMHLHGGGFVGGSIEMDDARCVAIARSANCIVASVDYRLAPEHRFPVAIEDAFAAWTWLKDKAAEVGSDGVRFAVSGSSAGGHIAAGLVLLADTYSAQRPALLVLAYPVLDPARNTRSYREFADGFMLTASRMDWYWRQYTGPQVASVTEELLDPLAINLGRFPRTFCVIAECDVLRDEAKALQSRLREAGVDARGEVYPGMIHGFLTILPEHPQSLAALAGIVAALREAFEKQPSQVQPACPPG